MNYNYLEELEDFDENNEDSNNEIEQFIKKNNKAKKNSSKQTKFRDDNKKYK